MAYSQEYADQMRTALLEIVSHPTAGSWECEPLAAIAAITALAARALMPLPAKAAESFQTATEELLAIARRIADARERDDWNDLDDAVDDLIEAATVGHPVSEECHGA